MRWWVHHAVAVHTVSSDSRAPTYSRELGGSGGNPGWKHLKRDTPNWRHPRGAAVRAERGAGMAGQGTTYDSVPRRICLTHNANGVWTDGSGGKPGRKRLKRDTPDRHSPPGGAPPAGSGAGVAGAGSGGQRGGSAGTPPGAPLQLDPLVGYKVQRFWPQNGGWFDGIISDYNLTTNEHWCAHHTAAGYVQIGSVLTGWRAGLCPA